MFVWLYGAINSSDMGGPFQNRNVKEAWFCVNLVTKSYNSSCFCSKPCFIQSPVWGRCYDVIRMCLAFRTGLQRETRAATLSLCGCHKVDYNLKWVCTEVRLQAGKDIQPLLLSWTWIFGTLSFVSLLNWAETQYLDTQYPILTVYSTGTQLVLFTAV